MGKLASSLPARPAYHSCGGRVQCVALPVASCRHSPLPSPPCCPLCPSLLLTHGWPPLRSALTPFRRPGCVALSPDGMIGVLGDTALSLLDVVDLVYCGQSAAPRHEVLAGSVRLPFFTGSQLGHEGRGGGVRVFLFESHNCNLNWRLHPLLCPSA